ncbi:MAG: glycoside hydrolase family 31 protein [Clostridiales bacterium]|nr:glycoside hydrolase family 31 protein [Clostridiales bacterium]
MLFQKDHMLVSRFNDEKIFVEAWGENGVRVRITKNAALRGDRWSALLPDGAKQADEINITANNCATLKNGKITACFEQNVLVFRNEKGEELLAEFWQGNRPLDKKVPHNPIYFASRIWYPQAAGASRIEYRFKAYDDEKIFGMGQYQDDRFDRKGSTLELAPRNTQASIPFYYSSRGYGFLWNNPCLGRATFGANYTQWEAVSTDELDFWVTAGDSPREIERQYAEVTGKSPMMPDYAMGFWQCKLLYADQNELMTVAREYYRRKIPVKVIIIDFFHWTKFGNWFLDPKKWPDPKGMVEELKSMGMELMVSVWPSIETESDNYEEMLEAGYMIRTKAGLPFGCLFGSNITFVDSTNPDARKYLWEKIKKNYYELGIRNYWLDCAEPEYSNPTFSNFVYDAGPAEMCANLYPVEYSKAFYEGLRESGEELPISLTRCAWAGTQRYGTLLWSGDIYATWKAFKQQIPSGQNVGMSGVPWWNTDIGGFIGGDRADPDYCELITRWFEWGTFCPVMRLHGAREGQREEGYTPPNEIWVYGEKADEIMEKHIRLRERMFPYIKRCMQEATETGDPVIRAMFYEFPNDEKAWNLPYQYMLGSDLLVAPVLEPGVTELAVYLPEGESWIDIRDGKEYAGGQTVTLPAPLESIPVLRRKSAEAMFEF